MRQAGEFADYVVARWPVLVRSLVLLGCPSHRAGEVATSGLSRCCPSWGRVDRADDVDVFVYRTVLASWGRARRRWVGAPPGLHGEVAPLRRALVDELDRFTPDLRAVLVLRFVAELTAAQVAEVLDLPVDEVEERTATALRRLDFAAMREVAG